MRGLFKSFRLGVLTTSVVLLVIIWGGELAAYYPPNFIRGDCIGEEPLGEVVVGPYICYATCPIAFPPDPGKCKYVGWDYELDWGQVTDYENTGDLTSYYYLTWDCTDLVQDTCLWVDCPDEVDFECYSYFYYNEIEPDPNCP